MKRLVVGSPDCEPSPGVGTSHGVCRFSGRYATEHDCCDLRSRCDAAVYPTALLSATKQGLLC